MNDRPVNANTIEQIDREAQELVSANQAFSKRKRLKACEMVSHINRSPAVT